MRRFEILWLHACGKFAPEIALLVRQTPPTVQGVMNMYQKGGIKLVTAMDAGRPIVIVLDNARYQHGKLVEGLAKELGITLQFLPSYSPNLNLIKRL